MMNRKTFMTRLAVGLLAAPYLQAQQAGKVFRIGLLLPGTEPTPAGGSAMEVEARSFSSLPEPQRGQALLAGLRDLGWVEGRNLMLETRWGV